MKKEWLHDFSGVLLYVLTLWSIYLHVSASIAIDSYFDTHPEASRGIWEWPLLTWIYALIVADQGYEPAKWLVAPILVQIVLMPTVIGWWDRLRQEVWSEQYGGNHSPPQHGGE